MLLSKAPAPEKLVKPAAVSPCHAAGSGAASPRHAHPARAPSGLLSSVQITPPLLKESVISREVKPVLFSSWHLSPRPPPSEPALLRTARVTSAKQGSARLVSGLAKSDGGEPFQAASRCPGAAESGHPQALLHTLGRTGGECPRRRPAGPPRAPGEARVTSDTVGDEVFKKRSC